MKRESVRMIIQHERIARNLYRSAHGMHVLSQLPSHERGHARSMGHVLSFRADSHIRRAQIKRSAVEILSGAMDAVEDSFPGVLDYPIVMGKCPRYEDLDILQSREYFPGE